MFTLAIANQKGGVGKTTTAVNIAHFLSLTGRRVLLLDMDPQANATSGLGLELPDELPHTQSPPHSPNQIQLTPLTSRWPNLTAIPARADLVELERAGSPLLDFSGALGLLARQVDIAIIDCPPSLGNLTKNALAAADGILVPVQCEYYPMEGLIRLIDLINVVRSDRNERLSIKGLLLTMFDERAAISTEVEVEIRKHFGDEVLKTVIPRDPALAEAPSYGLPIFEYAARSPGAAAYLGAAKEVLARIGAKEEENA